MFDGIGCSQCLKPENMYVNQNVLWLSLQKMSSFTSNVMLDERVRYGEKGIKRNLAAYQIKNESN